MATEEDIIAQVLAGDTSDFRLLVERVGGPIFRYCCNLIGDQHEAEDITQEVFTAAFRCLSSYDSRRASFLTWLLTMARNRCTNHLRKRRPIPDGGSISEAGLSNSSDDSNRNEFWTQLNKALEALPLEQKSAFVLAEIEDLPYAQIALVEHTTLGTVKSRIHRAKQRLQGLMASTLESD